MTNKILDHVENVILEGQRRHVPAPVGVSFAIDMTADMAPNFSGVQMQMEGRLTGKCKEYVDENAPPEHRQRVKERAKAAIARHLYDDVVRGLRDVREAFWSEGVTRGPHLDKLDAMIREYSGEMSRFET